MKPRSIIRRTAWWVGAPCLAVSVLLLFFTRTHALGLIASPYEGANCSYGGFHFTWRTAPHPEGMLHSDDILFYCMPYPPGWDFRFAWQEPIAGTRELWIPGWTPIVLCAAWTMTPFVLRRRVPTGSCPRCGYDAAGLRGGAPCPECGRVENPAPLRVSTTAPRGGPL